jgi:hypothetical protein
MAMGTALIAPVPQIDLDGLNSRLADFIVCPQNSHSYSSLKGLLYYQEDTF